MIDHQDCIGMKSHQILDHKVSKISSHSLYSKIETEKKCPQGQKKIIIDPPPTKLPSLFPSRK